MADAVVAMVHAEVNGKCHDRCQMDVSSLASIWPRVPLALLPFEKQSLNALMSHADDAKTIARAAAGDRMAMRALIDQHNRAIYGLAFHMLGRAEDAEDVTQDAFLRAWKAFPKWRPEARLSTWLHKVTLNLCYDRLRKKRPALMAEPPDQSDPGPTPEKTLAARQTQTVVRAAIANLPPRQCAALTLTSLQGHSNLQAAEIMDIKLPALESLLARARRTLKARLAPLKETL